MRQSELLEQATEPADVAPPDPPEVEEAVTMIGDKLAGWADAAIAHLPNVVLAVVVLVLFWLGSKVVRRLLDAALRKTPLATPVRTLLTALAAIATLAVGLFFALGVVGLDKTVTSLLAGVGIIGLALGFAFQDLAANLMSGMMLSIRRPINVGDIVETNDFFGTVEEINLRATVVRRPTGQLVYIPNRAVLENPVINYTTLGTRRVDLKVGASYGDDLDKVREVALAAVGQVEGLLDGRPVELFFEEFGDSSINFVVRFWVDFDRQPDFLVARSEAIERLKKAFDEAGLTIPFPIRTLDFGIVGGQPLEESLRRGSGADS